MRRPNDMRFATVHLSTGLRLHYAECGDREREASLFLHAYADSWYWFSRVLPLLSREFRALVPDQRGHGDSDKPECCYTTDDFAADVDAFMKAVGVEKATLVGHSSGGLIAQRVALDYPRRVDRLVMIGAPATLVNNQTVAKAGVLSSPLVLRLYACYGNNRGAMPRGGLERPRSSRLRSPLRSPGGANLHTAGP